MPPVVAKSDSIAPIRVLVIEDQTDIAHVIRRCLEREGYDVRCEEDGDAGLELVVSGGVDLVVLDILLPGALDGYEICRRIRADPRAAHLPVIMLTAKGDDVDAARGFESGADDY